MSRITRDIETLIGAGAERSAAGLHPRRFGLVQKLRRHPIPIVAHFRHSLVLTYAFPRTLLKPLLPPGLVLDTYDDFGFVAIAMVQTEALRPAFAPRCIGQNFFLTGYRIFARYRTREGRLLRGLRILRSDTDRKLMAVVGNFLTHYNYRHARVDVREAASMLEINVQTPGHSADLRVVADLRNRPTAPPESSPFRNWHEARLFAGPLPFTFDYEPETHSLVMIEGVRRDWNPQPIAVEVHRADFFKRAPFSVARPILANAFHVANIDYRWNPGVVEALTPNLDRRESIVAFA